jgi:hypothetical protein
VDSLLPRPSGRGGRKRREVVLDVVYLLVVAALALVVGLVARGVEKL